MDTILFPKQQQAYNYLTDNTTTELLYGGGARGGKSWLGCFWQCKRRVDMPGSAGRKARAQQKKLQDTTQLTFFKAVAALGIQEYIHFNAQRQIATFANGSRIFFAEIKHLPSDPEYDRLGSYDLTDCFIDEAQEVNHKAISVLKGRFSVLTGPGGWHTLPKALYTCNPRKNWIYSDFVRPAREGTLEPHRKFIAALPTDNPCCPPEYIRNLETADRITRERLLYGNFDYDDDPATLCSFDAILDCFKNPESHMLYHPSPIDKYISADLAMQGRDKFVAGVWQGMVCRIGIVQDKSTGKSIERDLRALLAAERVPLNHLVADSDGQGNYLASYLEGITEFHGGSKAYNSQYANLKTECGYKLAELVNRRALKIVCDARQQQLIAQELGVLKAANIDADESKKQIIDKARMKALLGRSPDYLDMLLMRMVYEVRPQEALTMVWRRQS